MDLSETFDLIPASVTLFSVHQGTKLSVHLGSQGDLDVVKIQKLSDHPILEGIDVDTFKGRGSLYIVKPIADSTQAILSGMIDGEPAEPIAWTNKTKFGGKAFYTSLGHVGDFEQRQMNIMLRNAIDWAAAK